MAKEKQKQKQKQKRPVEDDEEEAGLGDMPDKDKGAEERAEARKKKKSKKQKVVEDVEEEPPVEEDDEPIDEEADEKTKKRILSSNRERRKVAGYRSKARECGFVKTNGLGGAGGEDMLAASLTSADAKRLMRFVPEVLNKSSYGFSECAARMALSLESVPDSAARVTQANCEAAMRKFVKDAVLLAVEKGARTIDAATMQAVLRAYQQGMTFSSVLPPRGLIRHAQTMAILGATVADEESAEQEKEENRSLSAAQRKIDAAELARKQAFRKRREELKAQREATA